MDNTLPTLNRAYLSKPADSPINIIQFGTGVLLRGLIDYIFQKANDASNFGASIAMVKSTSPDIEEFISQDNLYTVIASGLDHELKESIQSTIVDCVHETLAIEKDWTKLESLFSTSTVSVIISNVTEAGLTYLPIVEGDYNNYPANLTKLLYKRFQVLGTAKTNKLYIIPTELLVGNGSILRSLVLRHAREMQLDITFLTWLDQNTVFCDSLVDRIVPGKWRKNEKFSLPYIDHLAISTEPYFLWAIQGDNGLKQLFHFESKVSGIYISENIESFREQKLRLLNGCHTLLSTMAYAKGCITVEQMMNDPMIFSFFKTTCEHEILPTLKEISPNAVEFYHQMELRWKNPFIRHELKSILTQSISKWPARNGETIIRYYNKFGYLPPFITFGFSIFLYVYRPMSLNENKYVSSTEFPEIDFNDQKLSILYSYWKNYQKGNSADLKIRVHSILQAPNLFNHKFTSISGLADLIIDHFISLEQKGLTETLANYINKK